MCRAPQLASSGVTIPSIGAQDQGARKSANGRRSANAENVRDHRLRMVVEMARKAIGKLILVTHRS